MKDKTNEDSIKADNAVVKAPGMALAGTHDEVIRPGAGKLSQSAATSVGNERCTPLATTTDSVPEVLQRSLI